MLCHELIEWTARRLQFDGVNAQGEVEPAAGDRPARAILRVADRFGADLIVMGSRGLSDLAGLLIESVTHDVLHNATIPVLVVPGREAVRARRQQTVLIAQPVGA